jgi:hypothetical protein
MAAEKLTQLTQITLPPQPTDQLYIVRPSEGAAGSHSILYGSLFSGVGRMLPPNITPVTTIGSGGGDPLQTYVIPAGTLPNDGDFIRYNMAGFISDVETVRFVNPEIFAGISVEVGSPYFVNTGFFSTGIPQDNVTFVGATGWRIFGEVVRLTLNTLLFTGTFVFGWLGGFPDNTLSTENQGMFSISGTFTGATRNNISLANQFTLRAIALSTVAGNTTQNLTTVEVYNF